MPINLDDQAISQMYVHVYAHTHKHKDTSMYIDTHTHTKAHRHTDIHIYTHFEIVRIAPSVIWSLDDPSLPSLFKKNLSWRRQSPYSSVYPCCFTPLEYFPCVSFHVVGLISPDVTTAHILLHHVNLPAQKTGLYYSQDQGTSDPPTFPHPSQKAPFLPHIPEI